MNQQTKKYMELKKIHEEGKQKVKENFLNNKIEIRAYRIEYWFSTKNKIKILYSLYVVIYLYKIGYTIHSTYVIFFFYFCLETQWTEKHKQNKLLKFFFVLLFFVFSFSFIYFRFSKTEYLINLDSNTQ